MAERPVGAAEARSRIASCRSATSVSLPSKSDNGSPPGARPARNGDANATLGSSRIKPGTQMIRQWRDATHTVTALAEGFEWNGCTYKSLSAVANAITETSGSFSFLRTVPARNPRTECFCQPVSLTRTSTPAPSGVGAGQGSCLAWSRSVSGGKRLGFISNSGGLLCGCGHKILLDVKAAISPPRGQPRESASAGGKEGRK